MDFEDAVSVYADDAIDLQYQQCPHCSRSFFQGKLKLHLKLCNPISPMLKSPRKTPKMLINEPKGQIELRCEKCKMKLPGFLYEKHLSRCGVSMMQQKKVSTDIGFKQETTLPLIKSRQPQERRKTVRQPYQVRLREELSCFRKANEIKQVQCPACLRIFSKEASLRHIPICQTLKNNLALSVSRKEHLHRSAGQGLLRKKHQNIRIPPNNSSSPQSKSVLAMINPEPSEL